MLKPWLLPALACALLSAYSLKPGSPAPLLDLSWRDKVDHFLVYGLLAVLILKALPSTWQSTTRWISAFLCASLFGLWDEFLQSGNPARTGDPLDWLADSLGALLFVATYEAFPWIRRCADFQLQSFVRKTNPSR